ncbi:MAG TPA: hypothetical protein VF650_09840 [Allosphingosinicella sp.]|jgi:hypothetical protein
MTTVFLYDDRATPPASVHQIIGADRFSQVMRRRQRLGDMIAKTAAAGKLAFRAISSPADLAAAIEWIERMDEQDFVLRLPAALMPSDLARFEQTLTKLPYATEPALYGPRFEDESVALLRRDDALALLRTGEARDRRWFLSNFEQRATLIPNACGFVDLRDVRSFLGFMSGATEARQFNETSIGGPIFTKSSADREKMRAEYGFFHSAPEALKRFLVPTFDYRETEGGAAYSMENLAVPDSALQMIHHSFEPRSFATLLDRFFEFVAARPRRHVGAAAVRERGLKDIVGKMESRLDTLMNGALGARIDGLLRETGRCGGLEEMRARSRRLVSAAIERDPAADLAFSHGDPCLSNILFNRELGLFRLIDPRGAVTAEDGYLHPVYDLAKFSHSILGHYDFINNGLFACQLTEDLELELELEDGGVPEWAQQAFVARLEAEGFDYRTVRACELSLFMSLLPLHSDVPRKLPAFCLTACRIIEELEKSS